MRRIKKIDLYLLKTFLGLLLVTFLICIFILLMQFVWMHIKDLVGKGVEISVLCEFFVYAVASVVPLALPLAILLASLMTFGNLGEKFELTAMKAAGVDAEAYKATLMAEVNASMPAYSKINLVEIMEQPFEKTPKMSIKRFMYK